MTFLNKMAGKQQPGAVPQTLLRKAMLYADLGTNFKPMGLPHPQILDFQSLVALQSSVKAALVARLGLHDVEIDHLFYFRKRGMAPISISSSPDVIHALAEYMPKSDVKVGVKYHSAAADSLETLQTDGPLSPRPPATKTKLRESPRQKRMEPLYTFDITLTLGVEKNSAKGPNVTIHNLASDSTLEDIKKRVRSRTYSTTVKPNIMGGFYWMKKKGKELVILETTEDWGKAKEGYTNAKGQISDMKLAVFTIPNKDIKTPKRKLEGDFDEYGELEAQELIDSKVPAKKENNKYNELYLGLVKHLREKGVHERYTNKHINLWVELLLDGTLSSVREEPVWERYIERVDFLPRAGQHSFNKTKGGQTDWMGFMAMQEESRMQREEKREEQERRMREENRLREERREQEERRAREDSKNQFQAMMFAMLSPRQAAGGVPVQIPVMPNTPQEPVKEPVLPNTPQEVAAWLEREGMQAYSNVFLDQGISGDILGQLDHEALKELKVESGIDRAKILAKVKSLCQ